METRTQRFYLQNCFPAVLSWKWQCQSDLEGEGRRLILNKFQNSKNWMLQQDFLFWGKRSDDPSSHKDTPQRVTENNNNHLLCSQIYNLSRVWKEQLFSVQRQLSGSSGAEDLLPRWLTPCWQVGSGSWFLSTGASPQCVLGFLTAWWLGSKSSIPRDGRGDVSIS